MLIKRLIEPFQYPRINRSITESSRSQSVAKNGANDVANDGEKKRSTRNWSNTLKRIWLYLSDRKGQLGLVLLMVFVSSAMALLGPFFVGRAIDDLTYGQAENLLSYLVILVFVYIVHSLTIWLQNIWMIGIAQQTVFRMRTELFRQLLKLPLPFFDKRQHGELMSRVTNDIENVSTTLNSSFIQIATSILTLIGTLSIMIWLSPLLTLLSLIVVPLMVFGMKWITNRTGRMFKEVQHHLGDLNGHIEETLSGQRIVKTFSLEQKVIDEFRMRNMKLKEASFWAQTFSGFIPKLMNGLNNLNFAIICGVGGLLALNNVITVGVIVIFAEYTRQFTRPLNDLANQFNTFLSAIAGAERVFEIIDEKDEAEGDGEQIEMPPIKGHVQFDNVSFTYEKGEDTLTDVSFTAYPGETIALVGPTGAGKSTTIHLLSRFYDVDSGCIRIDGIDIAKVSRESLRKQFAFVLQDSFLFHGTIRENIRYGRLNATDEEVVAAAKEANAHRFIMRLPQGYDTVLQSDGGGISQGQKQLLTIARAMLADPALLILDEATSSIDTVTEMHIQEALERLMRERTSFVIAHRLNTIQRADRILVLHQGRLIEQGTHEQLLRRGGFYADLHAGIVHKLAN